MAMNRPEGNRASREKLEIINGKVRISLNDLLDALLLMYKTIPKDIFRIFNIRMTETEFLETRIDGEKGELLRNGGAIVEEKFISAYAEGFCTISIVNFIDALKGGSITAELLAKLGVQIPLTQVFLNFSIEDTKRLRELGVILNDRRGATTEGVGEQQRRKTREAVVESGVMKETPTEVGKNHTPGLLGGRKARREEPKSQATISTVLNTIERGYVPRENARAAVEAAQRETSQNPLVEEEVPHSGLFKNPKTNGGNEAVKGWSSSLGVATDSIDKWDSEFRRSSSSGRGKKAVPEDQANPFIKVPTKPIQEAWEESLTRTIPLSGLTRGRQKAPEEQAPEEQTKARQEEINRLLELYEKTKE